MDASKVGHSSDSREEFIRKRGIELFLAVRRCFEVAPLKDEAGFMFLEEMIKILHTKFASHLLPTWLHLRDALSECVSFPDFPFDHTKSIFLLPPPYVDCPVGCLDEQEIQQKMVAVPHAPTHAKVYEMSGSCRLAFVLRRMCRTCGCTLQYDMAFCNKKYQFYCEKRPYVRITPNCYFSRPLCEHIVRTLARGRSTFESFAELWREGHNLEVFGRKWISVAFYRHEVEDEIRNRDFVTFPFSSYNSFDEVLPSIEEKYSSNGFHHVHTERCLLYKCKWFLVGDGIWSINFPHCAAPVRTDVEGYPHINLPPVCPMQPEKGKVYCALHSNLAGLAGQPVTKKQMEVLRQSATVQQAQQIFSTPELMHLFESMQNSAAETLSLKDALPYRCSKNLGSRPGAGPQLLAGSVDTITVFPSKSPRSRGFLVVSRPCGQIVSAVPIYRSESPSQVFLTTLATLYRTVQENNIAAEDWNRIFVVYDNVCNLDRIRTANHLLPLPSPYDRLWLDVRKVIDVFHLPNHVRPECRTVYNPNQIKKVHPDLKKRNTEVGEQNFSWMRQFKSVLNSIPRNRQLFYLYRLITHRNAYLSRCHSTAASGTTV